MTDGRSRLVLVVMAVLVLAVLGFWLWRSEPTVAPNPAPQPAVASDVATTLAAGNETAAAPIERTEAPAPPPPEPATNADLHAHSDGVATNSLHLKGKAIDIRLTDIPLEHLRRAALGARRGGVGYYKASNFVHVDTGRVRTW